MRVLPSSVIVVCSGPMVTRAVSTGVGLGHKPATMSASNIAAPAYGNQRRFEFTDPAFARTGETDWVESLFVMVFMFYSGARNAPIKLSRSNFRNTNSADAIDAIVTITAAIA